MATTEIEGVCGSRFKEVQEAFIENFAKRGEVGAPVAIYVEGRPVVDLWAGHADKNRTTSWERDTIVNVYSSTKGATTICAHRLVEQERLDVDAPVASYWPEFAEAGKEGIPVRYLLSHQAGMPAVRETLPPDSLYDWDVMTAALAKQEPWWEPGTKHGYHAVTFGWLVGEVVRRISGKSLGAFFHDEVAEPLGLDFHIGMSAEHDSRTADIIPARPPEPGEPNPMAQRMADRESLAARALSLGGSGGVNSREWRAAELPAANGHTNARGLARLYAPLGLRGDLDGVHLLTEDTVKAAIVEQANGMDEVLGMHTVFALGFMVPGGDTFAVPSPGAFGHPGAGGSLGFADPGAGVGFGYAMNQMMTAGGDSTSAPLIEALYAALG